MTPWKQLVLLEELLVWSVHSLSLSEAVTLDLDSGLAAAESEARVNDRAKKCALAVRTARSHVLQHGFDPKLCPQPAFV